MVVLLSGHGVHFKGDKSGSFCPVDAKISTKKNLLPMDGTGGLYPLLEECKAGLANLIAVFATVPGKHAGLTAKAHKGLVRVTL